MKQSLLKKLWLRTSLLVAVILCGAGTAWGQDDVVEISTVEQLKAFRDAVNAGTTYAGKTVKLTANLDLSGEANWTPIGNLVAYPGQSFNGIFDGDGHTISNLTVNDNTPNHAVAGFFGSIVNGTIKNLTVKNVNITSTHYAAGIVAYTSNTPTIENCHVIGGTIKSTPEIVNGSYDNGDKVGGIMGYATAGSTINNCTVEGVTITGYRDLGGIVGYSDGSVTSNTAKNVTVTQDLTNGYEDTPPTTIGDIVGRGSATNNVEANGNKVVKSDPVAQIGETKYETLAEAVAAANTGDVIEIIKAGGYKLPNLSKNVTIEGKADGVVFKDIVANPTNENNIASIPSGATFKNVAFEVGNIDYHGFTHAGIINMEGCTLNGKFFSYGDMNFTNCTFEQTNSDYHMWVYGPSTVKYTCCTFNGKGKFLNVYREGPEENNVIVDQCTFNSDTKNKAAINVKATSGTTLLKANVTITNCTTNENFPEASSSDALVVLNSLVQVDDRTADGADNITVTQDDVLIYPATVAAIGDKKYPTLQAAVDAAQQLGGEQTINLIGDISGETVTIKEVANFKLTIDGKKDDSSNYTVDALIIVDGLRANGGSNTNGASVTLQNIAFVRTVSTDGIQATHYPHHLTIQNCTYSGSDNDKWFLNASVDGPLYGVTVKNVTVEHARLVYANMADDAVFQNITATNDVKVGFNVKTSGTALIENCQVTTGKYAFRDYSDGYAGTFTLKDNTFISTSEASDEGVIVNRGGTVGTSHINVESGSYSGHVKVLNNKEGVLAVSGGIFSESVPEEFCAEGYITAANPDTETNEAYPYMVKEGKYVAQVGEQKFETFTEAVAALTEENNTITLLDNIAEPYTLAEAQSLNVNLNGKTLNVEVPEGFILKTTVADGVTTYVCAAPVAKIGDTMFASLADAVAAVPADGTEAITITMIADETINVEGYAITIPATKNVVLELNGHQIIGACVSTGTSALIRNLGTLTIQDNTDANKDGSGDGKIIAGADPTWTWDGSDDYSGSYASNLVRNEGTLVIEGGNLNNVSSGSAAYAIDNYGSGKITINGGKVDAAKASAIRMFYVNGGSITVNDGTIGHYTSDDDCSYMGVQVMSGANVNVSVNGGTIAGDYALYANNTGGSINISGGTFEGYVAFGSAGPNDISITDGTFYAWVGTWGDQTKFISGGTYYENPDTEYIADGFVAVKKGDVYVVIPESELPVTPTIFHDSGTYEGSLDVAIAGEGTIMYKLNDGAATAYTAPITIDVTTIVTAWAEKDGVKSNEETKTFTIVAKQAGAEVADGYYTIQTSDRKYVNVAGRKTVTLTSDTKSAGTVIRVSADADGVKVLRSQGVDVPGYAKKAMNYVPEIVQLAVDKLHAEGSGAILGEHGLDAIMEEFNKSFDYNLYLEKSGEAYRIYGRTPSMKPVVDFYAKNKANVDAKLPQLEAFINSAIDKVLQKTGGRGASILVDFKLHDVWQNMGGTLTEPTDEASTLKFYEEVLSSETNVWNFAYQTAMIYWGNVKNHPRFSEIKDKLGDYSKYIDKVENIRPNFKYYIVPSGSGVDFISEGNEAIINNQASAAWTMQAVTTFQVELPTEKNVTVYPTSGGTQKTYKEYYTTLYTDFAYTLPKGVKAYKVTAITDQGVTKREEITGTIPAQTPVLLVGESNEATLTLSTEAGTAITDNLLVGPDALINEYQIQTPQVVDLFDFAKSILGESAYVTYVKKYEHLMLKNAGTVNNKYFFGLTEEDVNKCVYDTEDGEDCVVRGLDVSEGVVAFHDNWKVSANSAFLVSEEFSPVKLFLVGDVNRDGIVSIADVTALVNIILGKAKYPADNDKYDFEAANVNGDEIISIADVTALVNIILGK